MKDDGVKLTLGNHSFQYVAIDAFKNKAKCTFVISVIDVTPPTIENCIDPPEIFIPTSKNASLKDKFVDWDPPLIYDNSDLEVNVSQSLVPGLIEVGVHLAQYVAVDTSGNENVCIMNLTVSALQCKHLMSPSNGQSLCAKNSTHTWCEISCADGFTIAGNESSDDHYDAITVYCENDVAKWTHEHLLECAKTETPDFIEQVITIGIDDDQLWCNETNEEFQTKISIDLKTQLCGESNDCEIVSELPKCEEVVANRSLLVEPGNSTFYHVIRRREISSSNAGSNSTMKIRVYTRISKKLGLWNSNLPRTENIQRVKSELRTYHSNEELRIKLSALKINVKHLNLEEVPLCRNGTVLKKNICGAFVISFFYRETIVR